MGQETSKGLKWSLRILSSISAVIGIGFIIWSTIIQSPPKSALPVGLIVLGALALVLALVGLFHSMCGRLAPLTADQVAEQESLTSNLEIGRYVFLVFIILQFIALLVTIVMRVKFPHVTESEDFEEQRGARSAMAQIQMESLKNSVSRNKQATSPAPSEGNFYAASNKMYKSVTKRMSQKYGEFTQDPAFQKKWWQGIPGFK
ncbi:hypothetical protein NADE_004769 [Nannochloris sp. 'desiccata']|nr:hypothetical protein KSW81_006747 [Chlorella desiccata (nom. nud.)]KAH7622182.1 hypothetical protein NADE_004769 [Chlorella desiccata (nom. nud.)]